MNADPLHLELWLLALIATVLRVQPWLPSELVEDLAWNSTIDAILERVPPN